MTYLVDANILSESTKPQPNRDVVEWLKENESDIVIDSLILSEIRLGIVLLPKGKKREGLEHWFEAGIQKLICLPWDRDTAIRWAQLIADLRHAGRSMPLIDSMIAATVLTHGLTVVTRNSKDFEKAGLHVVNPFEEKTTRRSPNQ